MIIFLTVSLRIVVFGKRIAIMWVVWLVIHMDMLGKGCWDLRLNYQELVQGKKKT